MSSSDLEMKNAVSSIAMAAAELQKGLDDVQKFKRATQHLNDSAEHSASLISRLTVAAERMHGAATTLEESDRRNAEQMARFESALHEGLEGVRDSVSRIASEMETSFKKSGEKSDQLQVEVHSSEQRLQQAVLGIQNQINAQLSRIASGMETSFKKIGEKSDQLGVEVHNSEERLQRAVMGIQNQINAQQSFLKEFADSVRANQEAVRQSASKYRRNEAIAGIIFAVLQLLILWKLLGPK